MHKVLRFFLLSIVALISLGCAKPDTELLSATELLAQGRLQEDAADFNSAVATYKELQANYPFGTYAQQALLNLTHLYFVQREYEQAHATAEQFIQDYPAHTNLDYAYYIRAVSLQRDRADFLAQIILANTGNRSHADLVLAYDAFYSLIKQYPQSLYVDDSIDRLNAIVNQLAESELRTSLHYFRVGAYPAALRRSTQVIVTYPNSEVGELALAIMVASLVEMQADKPLADSIASLRENFPNSKFLEPARTGQAALLDYLDIDPVLGDYFTKMIP